MSLQICADLRQQFRAHSLSSPQNKIEDVIQLPGLLLHSWEALLKKDRPGKRSYPNSLPQPSRKRRAKDLESEAECVHLCIYESCKDRRFDSERSLQMHV